jgi:hypothetical protein
VAYVSFKHGDGATVRCSDGRQFLDMDEPALQDIVGRPAGGLTIESCWTAADSLDPINRPAWLNALLTTRSSGGVAPVVAAGAAGAVDPPGWVKAMAHAPPLPSRNPAEDPDGWILAHVDVETTGLAPGYHDMIDLGVRPTSLNTRRL